MPVFDWRNQGTGHQTRSAVLHDGMKQRGLAHTVEDRNESDEYFAQQNKSCTVNRNSWYVRLKISDGFQDILTSKCREVVQGLSSIFAELRA